MQDAETILVIILSVTLSIFLGAAIVFTIALIKLVKTLNQVALKATEVIDNVETAAATLRKAAGPLAAGKLLMNIFSLVNKTRKGR